MKSKSWNSGQPEASNRALSPKTNTANTRPYNPNTKSPTLNPNTSGCHRKPVSMSPAHDTSPMGGGFGGGSAALETQIMRYS